MTFQFLFFGLLFSYFKALCCVICDNLVFVNDARTFERLVNQRTDLANQMADKQKELAALLEEYNKIEQVITLQELSIERSGNTTKKTRLTKELYQGQLVVAA